MSPSTEYVQKLLYFAARICDHWRPVSSKRSTFLTAVSYIGPAGVIATTAINRFMRGKGRGMLPIGSVGSV